MANRPCPFLGWYQSQQTWQSSRSGQIDSLLLHGSDDGRSVYERLGFIAGEEMYFAGVSILPLGIAIESETGSYPGLLTESNSAVGASFQLKGLQSYTVITTDLRFTFVALIG
jgi:hypothetical protein